jgi:RimJ/RimL family protein N-acetyltransferase
VGALRRRAGRLGAGYRRALAARFTGTVLPAEPPRLAVSAVAAGQPPEEVPAGPVTLRRIRQEHAAAVAAEVRASLDHLRPWLPWATPEAAEYRAQLARIMDAQEEWQAGTDYEYAIFAVPDGALVGLIGLHRRVGEGGMEIGYWVTASQTRRGYVSAAARALTSVALELPGVRRVEIHCDEANVASASVPRKLGYRLARVCPHEREAPGEVGRRMIWVWEAPGGEPAPPGGEPAPPGGEPAPPGGSPR